MNKCSKYCCYTSKKGMSESVLKFTLNIRTKVNLCRMIASIFSLLTEILIDCFYRYTMNTFKQLKLLEHRCSLCYNGIRGLTTWSPLATNFNSKPSKKITFLSKVLHFSNFPLHKLSIGLTKLAFYVGWTFRNTRTA